jgi:hypothetical protein
MVQLPRHHVAGGWIVRADWLQVQSSQTALAVLVGLAIASGFQMARQAGDAR